MSQNPFCNIPISGDDIPDLAGIITENIALQEEAINDCLGKVKDEVVKGCVCSDEQIEKVVKKLIKTADKQTSQCCGEIGDVMQRMESTVINIITEQKIQNEMLINNINNLVNSVVNTTTNVDNSSVITNTTNVAQPVDVNVDVNVDNPITINLPDQAYNPTDVNSVLNFILAELRRISDCCDRIPSPQPIFVDNRVVDRPRDLGPPPIFIPTPIEDRPRDLGPPPIFLPPTEPTEDRPIVNDIDIYNTINAAINNAISVSVNVAPQPISIAFNPIINVNIQDTLPPPERRLPDPPPVDEPPVDEPPVDEPPVLPTQDHITTPTAASCTTNDAVDPFRNYLSWRFGCVTAPWRSNAAAFLQMPHLLRATNVYDLIEATRILQRGQARQG